tara:strand:- start:405 stop:611 length:207 start_codon:yes stop_codon:yes gene_type:complete
MGPPPLHINYEAHAAILMLVLWIIKTLGWETTVFNFGSHSNEKCKKEGATSTVCFFGLKTKIKQWGKV